MPSPDNEQARPTSGSALWINLEVVVDDEGRVSHYSIEGRPDGGPLHVHLDPQYDSTSPMGLLAAIGIELKGNLTDCTLMITSEPSEEDKPRLRIVENPEDEDRARGRG